MNKPKELKKTFFCPTNAWDCPYWKKDGSCGMVDEDNSDPILECDDAGAFYDAPGEGFVWVDEIGTIYNAEGLLELGYHFVNGEPVESFEEVVEDMKRGIEIPIFIKCTCPMCKTDAFICVDAFDYGAWQNGKHAQDAFPYLTPNDRERLISGICPKCWDKMWGGMDDES